MWTEGLMTVFGAVVLMTAIGIEVASTALLPRAQGFTHLGWTAAVLAGYAVSIWMLAIVVRTVPVSVAYAVWSGVGTAVVAALGYFFLGESLGWVKALSLGLIVVGVVGVNLAHA